MSAIAMAAHNNNNPFGEQDAYSQYGYNNNQIFSLNGSDLPTFNAGYTRLSFGNRVQPHGNLHPQQIDTFEYPTQPNTHTVYTPRQEINTAFSSIAHQNLTVPPHGDHVTTISPSQTQQQMQHMEHMESMEQTESMENMEQTGNMEQTQHMEQQNINPGPELLPYEEAFPKDRRDSIFIKEDDDGSPGARQVASGRRRKSEYAEPGSARAIYLEKNRKAASKCRNKQKQEQEQLVQRARDEERKNRILKKEVELLQAELRDIKGLLGHHANCPDRRIAAYLQMQADRLAPSHHFRTTY